MTSKERSLKIEEILIGASSNKVKSNQIFDLISSNAEYPDEIVPLIVIEKALPQMRSQSFRSLRSAILLVLVISFKGENVFFINKNLLKMDFEPIVINPEIQSKVNSIVMNNLKLPKIH